MRIGCATICLLVLAQSPPSRGDDTPVKRYPAEARLAPPNVADERNISQRTDGKWYILVPLSPFGDEHKLTIWGMASLKQRPTDPPANAPSDAKRLKWEYAEFSYLTTPGVPTVKIRWTTGTQEVIADGWEEMAVKLIAIKKKASEAGQRIRVLNEIGAAGWELVAQQSSAPTPPVEGLAVDNGLGRQRPVTTCLLFKRLVP